MKTRIRALALLTALALTLCAGCAVRPGRAAGDASALLPSWSVDAEPSAAPSAGPDRPDDGSWAIYWYVCGTDLESNGSGCATEDIRELLKVDLPENVTVVMQTGGTYDWDNSVVDPNYIERFVCDSEREMARVDRQELSSMGASDTLSDFLTFCRDNYPAEKTAFVFWNHGGGSVSGVSFDERYDYDSLTLDEIYTAFGTVYELSDEEPPFELVGFDACLMATIDTAYTFCDIARYMVASEETEPGSGWNYTGLAAALAEAPDMDGGELGRAICDTYYEQCASFGWEDEATLSLVDLSKLQPLLAAYDGMGQEALQNACADPIFFSSFGRCAQRSENYGGNTPEQGYTNLVDLGDLTRNARDLLPETAAAVLAALDDCVVYQVAGDYRESASGLSCYYSYSGDEDDFEGWLRIAASEPFKYYYSFEMEGELDDEAMSYAGSIGIDPGAVEEVPSTDDLGLEDAPLYLSDDGYAVMDIGPRAAEMLTAMYCDLCWFDMESDAILALGRDNDLFADWETGVFKDNFRGVWGALEGCPVYMEITDEGGYYNTYNVPILLNGEEYNLRVVYDFNLEEYRILGARRSIDEDTGMADKELVQLRDGDVVTTIHYMASLTGDDELSPYEVDTIVIDGEPSFTEEWLGDGTFAYMFEMVGPKNEMYLSSIAVFSIEGEEIYTELWQD